MIPVTFGACAGFLHPATTDAPLGRGVVICESFGYEALCNRRALMALAQMLASAGLPTLRFSYPGTGDSAGDGAEGDLERWIESINAARAYLKEVSGVSEVALFGMRLGGLLAIEAARRAGDVPALALLAPTLHGRLYVRELTLSGSMVEDQGAVETEWSEFLGFRLYPGDLARLRAMDERAAAGAAGKVLLLSQEEPLPEVDPSVEVRPFPHFEGLAQPTEYIFKPMRAFAEITSWLREGAPEACGTPRRAPEAPRLVLDDGTVEEAVRFGSGERCFGILSRPAGPAPDGDAPRAVVILNTGMNHHEGNGRGNVRLARSGVTALRIDMRDLGDSAQADPIAPVGFHDLHRIEDIKAALDVLEGEGHGTAHLTGICAGAYMGLHAAGADPRIVSATLVNLPYFYMRDEDPRVPLALRPTALWRRLAKPFAPKPGDAQDPGSWAVPGKNHFRRRWATNWGLRFVHYGSLWASERLLRGVRAVLPRSWAIGRTDRIFRRLHRLGVDVNLVYGGKDWGRYELGFVFGPGGERLLERGWARVTTIAEVDHPITTSAMQAVVAGVIEDDLAVRSPNMRPALGDAQFGFDAPAVVGEGAMARCAAAPAPVFAMNAGATAARQD